MGLVAGKELVVRHVKAQLLQRSTAGYAKGPAKTRDKHKCRIMLHIVTMRGRERERESFIFRLRGHMAAASAESGYPVF